MTHPIEEYLPILKRLATRNHDTPEEGEFREYIREALRDAYVSNPKGWANFYAESWRDSVEHAITHNKLSDETLDTLYAMFVLGGLHHKGRAP